MTVFLDTVGLLAVWDESDQWHGAAEACFSELLGCRADLVTSSFVLLECGNAAARRPYRSAVSRLRKQDGAGASSYRADQRRLADRVAGLRAWCG